MKSTMSSKRTSAGKEMDLSRDVSALWGADQPIVLRIFPSESWIPHHGDPGNFVSVGSRARGQSVQ